MYFYYEKLSSQFERMIVDGPKKVVGITGTSCIGKSTLTRLMKEKLEKHYSVQVINADSYLCEEYRGGSSLLNFADDYMKPLHFAWKNLSEDIQSLLNGNILERPCYVRGIGWDNIQILRPADIIIVEGLFLDSIEAAEYMEYDFLIALSAADDLIRKLRMERDNFYRENYKDFKRTVEGTKIEIERTLLAGKSYQRCTEKWNNVQIDVTEELY